MIPMHVAQQHEVDIAQPRVVGAGQGVAHVVEDPDAEGSSNSVARSFAQSSPSCEPRGVIFTFCANAGAVTSAIASAADAVFIFFSLGSENAV